jgi:redox-sensing transcriptional repressor
MADAPVSDKTVARLSLYRRLLNDLLNQGIRNVYSHQLASAAGVTAAQVRRDIMAVGYSGTPVRGYSVPEMIESIGNLLDSTQDQTAALVGLGNLGRAITAYFAGRRPKLAIMATFDNDPYKVGRIINDVECFHINDLGTIVEQRNIRVAILTIPAGEAQQIADMLVRAGVKGLLNFAPVRLRVPADVYVENMDMAVCLEKVAFFARQGRPTEEVPA